jgi:hypothetical protein
MFHKIRKNRRDGCVVQFLSTDTVTYDLNQALKIAKIIFDQAQNL